MATPQNHTKRNGIELVLTQNPQLLDKSGFKRILNPHKKIPTERPFKNGFEIHCIPTKRMAGAQPLPEISTGMH